MTLSLATPYRAPLPLYWHLRKGDRTGSKRVLPLSRPCVIEQDSRVNTHYPTHTSLPCAAVAHLPISPRTSFAFCFAMPASSTGDRVSTSISSSSSSTSSSYLSTSIFRKLSMALGGGEGGEMRTGQQDPTLACVHQLPFRVVGGGLDGYLAPGGGRCVHVAI